MYTESMGMFEKLNISANLNQNQEFLGSSSGAQRGSHGQTSLNKKISRKCTFKPDIKVFSANISTVLQILAAPINRIGDAHVAKINFPDTDTDGSTDINIDLDSRTNNY